MREAETDRRGSFLQRLLTFLGLDNGPADPLQIRIKARPRDVDF